MRHLITQYLTLLMFILAVTTVLAKPPEAPDDPFPVNDSEKIDTGSQDQWTDLIDITPDPDGGIPGDSWTSVGPDCTHDNLQSAIDSISADQPLIIVNKDYEFSGSTYQILNPPSSLAIIGGWDHCFFSPDDPLPDEQTVLDADGTGPVMSVSYNAAANDEFRIVNLRNLVLRGGHLSSFQSGAGLSISGRPGLLNVRLRNVTVTDNTSMLGHGGGINVSTSGDEVVDDPNEIQPPMLELDNASHVTNNTTGSFGGGIACTNSHENSLVQIVRAGAGRISGNQAMIGGGISMKGCNGAFRNGRPLTFVPGHGWIFNGGIVNNTASEYGGGLYVDDGAAVSVSGHAEFQFGGDSETAALVSNNTALHGGGIYAKGQGTLVGGLDAAIMDNSAEGEHQNSMGGGIYATDEAHVLLMRMTDEEGSHSRCAEPHSVGITGYIPPCSILSYNYSQFSGGAVEVTDGASLHVSNSRIEGNEALILGGVILVENDPDFGEFPRASAVIQNSLVTDNSGSSSLFEARPAGELEVRWSTVTNNNFLPQTSAFVATSSQDKPARFEIRSSIVWEDSGFMASRSGAVDNAIAYADCVIGFQDAEDTDLSTYSYYSHIDPELRNPEGDDYRLGPTSPAINYCDGFSAPPDLDIDGHDRGHLFEGEITEPPNPFPNGIYDIGAYVALPDGIFRDRFEN